MQFMINQEAHFCWGNAVNCVLAAQVTGNEAPEMEVDEKNFLPTAPKNADAADETESWCVSFLKTVIAFTLISAHACANVLLLLCSSFLQMCVGDP